MTRSVWQVSGGPADRPYAEVFLEHGVALIGPGHDGPWQPGRTGMEAGEFVRRFAEDLQTGDPLLLRTAIDEERLGAAPNENEMTAHLIVPPRLAAGKHRRRMAPYRRGAL